VRVPGRPRVIELVGPAGAGKTTLTLLLEAQGKAVRQSLWSLPAGPLLRGAVRQLPNVLAWYGDTGALLWDEFKLVARLDALHAALRSPPGDGERLFLLDEGPVYALSFLRVMGHERFRRGDREPWRQAALRRWAATLDAVVTLEAPDRVLASRIRGRDKPHLMKDRSDGDVAEFSAAYRAAIDRVLADLAAAGGPPVLTLDGGAGSPAEQGDRLLAALAGAVHAR
jgi:hypothetical protein